MAIHAAPFEGKLLVQEDVPHNQDPAEIAVENQLGTPIEHVWIADSRGRLFTSDQIAPGQRVRARRTTPAEAQRVLAQMLKGNEPRVPLGFDGDYRPSWFPSSRQWWPYSPVSEPNSRTSILERNLREVGGWAPPDSRSYLIVTGKAPRTVPLGTPRVREEASFHVIRGNW
jgi:hypothetical protein